ncbi:MAG TPA: cytochrome c3 family protein [Verrucomicrobiae bacterium]|nr:cytochrome c3 family protein [Verrucomicrobiae bacterium]
MPQIFQRRTNTIARTSILAAVIFFILAGWVLYAAYWAPYTTLQGVPLSQPVPFSHKHHVGGLGIDCRYCHTSVEKSAFAGLPPTETCMTCHSQLFNTSPMLAPVRESLATDAPLRWNRVNFVPDFVFFNHSIHVNKGIGCSNCHGELDQMPLTWKDQTLYMKFCLGCHDHPEQFIRPREQVFNLHWQPPPNQQAQGQKLVRDYHVNSVQLSDCSMCHR